MRSTSSSVTGCQCKGWTSIATFFTCSTRRMIGFVQKTAEANIENRKPAPYAQQTAGNDIRMQCWKTREATATTLMYSRACGGGSRNTIYPTYMATNENHFSQ